jgi:hypothetical protein
LTLAPVQDISPRAAEINAYINHFKSYHDDWCVTSYVKEIQAKYP